MHHTSYQEHWDQTLASDQNYKPDFRILKDIPVEVGGEQGKELVYAYTKYRTIQEIHQGLSPVPSVWRRVMFVHDNQLWDLEMGGLESTSEADGADFDHAVETLKILN